MNKSPRNSMIMQSADERVNNFDEVSCGYDYKLMKEEASRCLKCKHAPCMQGCPVSVSIPLFIERLAADDMEGAVKVITATNNLPAICGRVCPQERQCEGLCVRKDKLGGSVAIGALERYVGDYALANDCALPEKRVSNSRKAAIIGSGPAGLTCAADLAVAGFDVTVYEAFHKLGGVLTYGIPEFRLPKDKVVEKEIDKLRSLSVKFELNTVIGKTITMAELEKDYDAIFIGTGAGLPVFLGIEGENLNGVYSANEYLTRVNLMKAYLPDSKTPVFKGKKVVIIGAGNVAMDSARTARRLGAEATVIYRRSREEMNARVEEIEHAEEEGVVLKLLTNPVRITGENFVTGITCLKMELGEKDASGRRSPVPVDGSEFFIEADEVIVAIGTKPNPMLSKDCTALELSRKGTVVIDEAGMTNIDNVYAGGDCVTGSATVILAMGAGKRAARAIIEKLG